MKKHTTDESVKAGLQIEGDTAAHSNKGNHADGTGKPVPPVPETEKPDVNEIPDTKKPEVERTDINELPDTEPQEMPDTDTEEIPDPDE